MLGEQMQNVDHCLWQQASEVQRYSCAVLCFTECRTWECDIAGSEQQPSHTAFVVGLVAGLSERSG
jgi:hypothetical protein